ncbi:unnamed protein product [Parnassius apollo]|uniref:(apollo) hypothetical protein n=1 Tax=Parnassius apollo TaxID=110799 RepID=A0A8S3XE81_PARAO|nr:unnamed protein product [Parnassius apollo]
METQSKDGRPPKRVSSRRYRINDLQIEEWLEELEEENEFSDFDDSVEDPNYVEGNVLEQQEVLEKFEEQNAQSNESNFDSEEEEPLSSLASRDQGGQNYIGKNGFLWSKKEIARTSRTPAHNIIHVKYMFNRGACFQKY